LPGAAITGVIESPSLLLKLRIPCCFEGAVVVPAYTMVVDIGLTTEVKINRTE
jgi:hypothetical protein